MGMRFTRADLVSALELDETRAGLILDRLAGFLLPDGDDGLVFRHGLLRDAAYHGLSFRRRRALHRRVGESLELTGHADPTAVAADLTHHFFEAGVWGKALRYGLVAGFAAQAVYANVDAAAMLERALAAGSSWRGARPESVARAAEALGDVRLSLGELEQARAAFVLARRRVRGDVVERARLLRKEATVAYRLGEYARAQRVAAGRARAARAGQQPSRDRAAGSHRGAARDRRALARASARVGRVVSARDRRRRGGRRQEGARARACGSRPGLQRPRRGAARDLQRAGARDLRAARRPRQPGWRAQQPRHHRLLRRALERRARAVRAGARGLGSGR